MRARLRTAGLRDRLTHVFAPGPVTMLFVTVLSACGATTTTSHTTPGAATTTPHTMAAGDKSTSSQTTATLPGSPGADILFEQHAISPGFDVQPQQTVLQAADASPAIKAALANIRAAGGTGATIDAFNQAACDGIIVFYDEDVGQGALDPKAIVSPTYRPATLVGVQVETYAEPPTRRC
jgi:hypothetical protein